MYLLLALLGTAAVGWGLSEWLDDDNEEVEETPGEDTLEDDTGDDTILLGAGDEGTGGEGADSFVVTEQDQYNAADEDIEDVDYGQSLITDYDPDEDQLIIEGESAAAEEPVYKLYKDPDGGGYRLALEEAPLQSFVDLPNLSLEDGETFDYVYSVPSGDLESPAVEKTVTLLPEAYPEGLSFHDWDEAQGDHHTLFGTNADDSMQSGSGDDWTAQDDPDAFNHDPGEITLFSDDATLVDGGDGDDLMWVGKNATVFGGEGEDTINMYADPYGGRDGEAAEFADFTAGEDQLLVNYALDPGAGADYATVLAETRLTYDAASDMTTLTVFDDALARFAGDQTGLSFGFQPFEEASYWNDGAGGHDAYDAEGNPITDEELSQMDIIIKDAHMAQAFGDYQVPPSSWTSA